ncbi:hypothetical protein cand_000740 [Cryptosporidium andersoni]|uniref:Uncharacterized protein n=1 Tax=Cryptosporidium andersoni TaxID=117008 RepID=A0A1J4MQL6_9CRYT|nr:hypothetical protein cand_000740 [Cryptosporidium andersoni]
MELLSEAACAAAGCNIQYLENLLSNDDIIKKYWSIILNSIPESFHIKYYDFLLPIPIVDNKIVETIPEYSKSVILSCNNRDEGDNVSYKPLEVKIELICEWSINRCLDIVERTLDVKGLAIPFIIKVINRVIITYDETATINGDLLISNNLDILNNEFVLYLYSFYCILEQFCIFLDNAKVYSSESILSIWTKFIMYDPVSRINFVIDQIDESTYNSRLSELISLYHGTYSHIQSIQLANIKNTRKNRNKLGLKLAKSSNISYCEPFIVKTGLHGRYEFVETSIMADNYINFDVEINYNLLKESIVGNILMPFERVLIDYICKYLPLKKKTSSCIFLVSYLVCQSKTTMSIKDRIILCPIQVLQLILWSIHSISSPLYDLDALSLQEFVDELYECIPTRDIMLNYFSEPLIVQKDKSDMIKNSDNNELDYLMIYCPCCKRPAIKTRDKIYTTLYKEWLLEVYNSVDMIEKELLIVDLMRELPPIPKFTFSDILKSIVNSNILECFIIRLLHSINKQKERLEPGIIRKILLIYKNTNILAKLPNKPLGSEINILILFVEIYMTSNKLERCCDTILEEVVLCLFQGIDSSSSLSITDFTNSLSHFIKSIFTSNSKLHNSTILNVQDFIEKLLEYKYPNSINYRKKSLMVTKNFLKKVKYSIKLFTHIEILLSYEATLIKTEFIDECLSKVPGINEVLEISFNDIDVYKFNYNNPLDIINENEPMKVISDLFLANPNLCLLPLNNSLISNILEIVKSLDITNTNNLCCRFLINRFRITTLIHYGLINHAMVIIISTLIEYSLKNKLYENLDSYLFEIALNVIMDHSEKCTDHEYSSLTQCKLVDLLRTYFLALSPPKILLPLLHKEARLFLDQEEINLSLKEMPTTPAEWINPEIEIRNSNLYCTEFQYINSTIKALQENENINTLKDNFSENYLLSSNCIRFLKEKFVLYDSNTSYLEKISQIVKLYDKDSILGTSIDLLIFNGTISILMLRDLKINSYRKLEIVRGIQDFMTLICKPNDATLITVNKLVLFFQIYNNLYNVISNKEKAKYNRHLEILLKLEEQHPIYTISEGSVEWQERWIYWIKAVDLKSLFTLGQALDSFKENQNEDRNSPTVVMLHIYMLLESISTYKSANLAKIQNFQLNLNKLHLKIFEEFPFECLNLLCERYYNLNKGNSFEFLYLRMLMLIISNLADLKIKLNSFNNKLKYSLPYRYDSIEVFRLLLYLYRMWPKFDLTTVDHRNFKDTDTNTNEYGRLKIPITDVDYFLEEILIWCNWDNFCTFKKLIHSIDTSERLRLRITLCDISYNILIKAFEIENRFPTTYFSNLRFGPGISASTILLDLLKELIFDYTKTLKFLCTLSHSKNHQIDIVLLILDMEDELYSNSLVNSNNLSRLFIELRAFLALSEISKLDQKDNTVGYISLNGNSFELLRSYCFEQFLDESVSSSLIENIVLNLGFKYSQLIVEGFKCVTTSLSNKDSMYIWKYLSMTCKIFIEKGERYQENILLDFIKACIDIIQIFSNFKLKSSLPYILIDVLKTNNLINSEILPHCIFWCCSQMCHFSMVVSESLLQLELENIKDDIIENMIRDWTESYEENRNISFTKLTFGNILKLFSGLEFLKILFSVDNEDEDDKFRAFTPLLWVHHYDEWNVSNISGLCQGYTNEENKSIIHVIFSGFVFKVLKICIDNDLLYFSEFILLWTSFGRSLLLDQDEILLLNYLNTLKSHFELGLLSSNRAYLQSTLTYIRTEEVLKYKNNAVWNPQVNDIIKGILIILNGSTYLFSGTAFLDYILIPILTFESPDNENLLNIGQNLLNNFSIDYESVRYVDLIAVGLMLKVIMNYRRSLIQFIASQFVVMKCVNCAIKLISSDIGITNACQNALSCVYIILSNYLNLKPDNFNLTEFNLMHFDKNHLEFLSNSSDNYSNYKWFRLYLMNTQYLDSNSTQIINKVSEYILLLLNTYYCGFLNGQYIPYFEYLFSPKLIKKVLISHEKFSGMYSHINKQAQDILNKKDKYLQKDINIV